MVNEDRSLLRISTTDNGEPYAVAVIADGMGGSGDGSLASETALEAVKLWLDGQLQGILASANLWEKLPASVEQLFRQINERLLQLGELAGSRVGTTLSLVFLLNETYFICHIGDCRVYKVCGKKRLQMLTKDQTWISEQVRRGKISKRHARRHPKRHVLLQCLGMQKDFQLMKRKGFYTKQTMFLLCSDGFYDRVPDSGIERCLRDNIHAEGDLQNLSDLLLDKALDKQSNDNISVMLLRSAVSRFTVWKRLCHRFKNLNLLFPVEWRK
jgi:serine/threonine protein phosphatase PrpC